MVISARKTVQCRSLPAGFQNKPMEGSDIEHIVIKQELMDRMNDNDATIVHIDEVTIENDHDYGRGG